MPKNHPAVKRFYVYELRDRAEKILYVGMSTQPLRRLVQHRQQPWGNVIASLALYPVDSEDAAEQLEREKIKQHRPPFNRDGVEPRTRSCKTEILDIIKRHGPCTATQIRYAMRGAGSANGDQVSTIVSRLVARGDLIVVRSEPSKGGYFKEARVFALPPFPAT